eukprot:g11653.t1
MSTWQAGGWCEQCYTCGGGDVGICLKACFCPCCSYGSINEKLGNGYCGNCLLFFCCIHFQCFCHMGVRSQIREKYGIEDGCNDCCITFCCPCCALIQEERELNMRGSAGAGPATQIIE